MIQITVQQKGARLESIREIVEAAIKTKYPNASVMITRQEPPETRAEKFAHAQSLASDAKGVAEELTEELQSWLDGLPENLQSGSKADELSEAISGLEEFTEAMDTAENSSVTFPSMY